MVRLGASKKTIAALLCISTVFVIFILNSQLNSSTRRRIRYETRHTLSVPLTLNLSKNVTILRLPDANNHIHRYKLERIDEEEEEEEDYWRDEEEEEKEMMNLREGAVKEQFEIRADEAKKNLEDGLKVKEMPNQTVDREPQVKRPPQTNSKDMQFKHQALNISKEGNYLLQVSDPRYGRMIGKVLSKLPKDVRKDMTMNIRMVESRTRMDFMKLPTNKQWEVILRVYASKGYKQRFPDVINIGVKKSGTNALGFFFPQHPQIVHSIGNEVHYFDWMYEKGLSYYKSRMGFAKPSMLAFEKTPRYFVTALAPKRILADLPTKPKFILCVRDPISRLISDFRHESELKLRREFKSNRLKYASRTGQFEGERLKREILDKFGHVNGSNEMVDTSVFVKHYKNWLQSFPPERILVIDQVKMEKDVYAEMKRLEEFLELEPFFSPSMFYFDPAKNGICMREGHLPNRNCPAKSTPSVLPKAIIDPETLAKLKEFYRPFNQEFSQLTGMSFSWAN
nr:heparan sulfate glucosamine 3-O-sulfotransferase 1-like [Lytechinus pictus]